MAGVLAAGGPWGTALAQSGPAPETVRKGSAGGILFRATRGDATVLVYGILHVGEESFYPLRPVILQPLRRSQALLVEVDVLAADLPAQFRRYGLLPEGAAPARIEAAHRVRVDQALRSAGIDPAFAARFKSDVLAAMLALASARQLGLTSEYSVDSFVIGFARALDIPVVEMEGLQRQLTLNDGVPAQDLQGSLDEGVQALASGATVRTMARMVRAWRGNDLDLLSRLYTDANAGSTRERQRRQMAQRNEAMADFIAGRAAQVRRQFVAVGVFHLVEPASLQSRLAQRGFAVERVQWSGEDLQ